MTAKTANLHSVYQEAFDVLLRAVKLERDRGRSSVHAYVTLFSGTSDYLFRGGILNAKIFETLDDLSIDAATFFPRDTQLREAWRKIETRLSEWEMQQRKNQRRAE